MKRTSPKQWLGTVAAILLLAQAVSAAPASAVGPTSTAPGASTIDKAVADGLAERTLTGAVVGVLKDGKIVLIKGYGMADLEDDQPVKPDTIFRIGSISKQFTSAMILLLVERGELSLDDPMSRYFPDFPHSEGITVRHLLNHTSGIRSFLSNAFRRSEGWREHDTKEMVSYIAHQDDLTDFAVGSNYRYNNSAYVLAGAIVEKVTGKSYAVALRDMITAPLGLTDTTYDDERAVVPRRAKGYDLRDGKATYPEPFSVSVAGGAGAMRSTAADMLRWHQALFGGKFLKPESLSQMIEPATLNDGRPTSLVQKPDPKGRPPMDYGLGLKLGNQDGRRLIGHGGAINGFNAMLYTFPDDKTTIVMLSNTSGGVHELYWSVVDAWLGTGSNKGLSAEKP